MWLLLSCRWEGSLTRLKWWLTFPGRTTYKTTINQQSSLPSQKSLLRLQQPWLHIRYGWMCRGCLRNSSITAHTYWPYSVYFDGSAIPSLLPSSSQSKCYITTMNLIVAPCISYSSTINQQMHLYNFHLKHFKTLKTTPTCFYLFRSSSGSFVVPC